MPLWTFSHTKDLFSSEEKSQLAQQITELYTNFGLPPFYVNVRFTNMEPSDMYVGGQSPTLFTTLSIFHIARSFQSNEEKAQFLSLIDNILTPLFEAKGMTWEYFIQETPRELWKIQGLYPPPYGSAEEQEWFRLNRPVNSSAGRAQL